MLLCHLPKLYHLTLSTEHSPFASEHVQEHLPEVPRLQSGLEHGTLQ